VKIGQWLQVCTRRIRVRPLDRLPATRPPRRTAHPVRADSLTHLTQACLTGLDARQALQAVTLLARASTDDPHAEEMLRQALPGTADLITGIQAPARKH
jgi:hypothetical protein